jgi:hypothetical protein
MFKLNIECTKDIDELHINFSDGSSVVTTKPSNDVQLETAPVTETHQETRRKGQDLDLDMDFGDVSQEIIKPPEIHREEREVKVAEELQNFDF